MAAEEGAFVPRTHSRLAAGERPLDGRLRVLAWLASLALAASMLTLFAAGIPVRYVQRAHPAPAVRVALTHLGLTPVGYTLITVALDIAVVTVFAATGLTLLWRARATPMALLGGVMLVGLGVIVFSDEGSAFNAASPIARDIVTLLGVAFGTAILLFFYTFPDGRFVPWWTRWAALAWAAFFSMFTVFNVFLDPQRWPMALYLPVVVLLWGTFPVAQVIRYRRVSDPAQRQQTKWVAYGVAVAIGGLLATWIVGVALFGGTDTPSAAIGAQLLGRLSQAVWLCVLPVCVALAVLRQRLWDIDLVINRTLVYAVLTALVGGLYVLLVGVLGLLLPVQGHLLASLVATGLIAALFAPLRLRVQRAVNRLLYGERDEPYAVLARLGARLDAALAPEAVLPSIVATVRDALKLPYAAIILADDPATRVAAGTAGTAAGEVVVPLTYQGAPVGALHVAPRAGTRDLSPADRRLLDDLAHHTGAAVQGVRLHQALQAALQDLHASRARLVTAREEERRRLRRDLHDDLAPTLAALALTASAAQDTVVADPATAQRLLGTLHDALRGSVGQVRRLVDDLRPPTLDELGLATALRERAAQVSSAGSSAAPSVVVDAPTALAPLPAAVEVAAYRIAQEALMNVVKHAQARQCLLSLTLDEQPPGAPALQVEITDDGVGLPAAPARGVGLGSMRERAIEVGGTCVIERRTPGGTRVLARLPLARQEERG